TPGNNSATDTDTVNLVADLSITKTDGVATVTPGTSTMYTIVVNNNGPSSVTGATVSDILPASVGSDTFTAVGSGGASGFTASGSGNINDTGASDAEDVTVTDALPPGVTLTAAVSCVANGSASCGTATGGIGETSFGTTGASIGAGVGSSLVFTVPVAFDSGMTANPLVNTATATDVATNATASGSDNDTLAPQVTLAVVKRDGSSTYTPGGTATHTDTVTDGRLHDAPDLPVG